MSGVINLHKKLGVNPRLTFCPQCGGDAKEIVLMGNKNWKDTCRRCGTIHYGGAERGKCLKCGSHQLFDRVELDDFEKVPGGLCDKCAVIEKEQQQAIEAGGVYFKCAECKAFGVVKNTETSRELCEEVRDKGGSGVSFESCEAHKNLFPGKNETNAAD